MKKVTRKALLTAKLYRPGKAGGGPTKKKQYTLVPDVSRREVRAVSPTGSEVGYLSMEKYGDAAQNNEAFKMAVKPAWQRQGIMTALHDEAEKHFGTINPSRLLSDDGFAFWKTYRPDAVRNSYRFHADRIMGKPVSTSKGDGVISSIGDNVMIAKQDDGSTFLVPDEISDQMFKQAQAEAAQEQQPEDDITKADGGSILMPGDPQREANLQDFMGNNHPEVPAVLYHGTDRDFGTFSHKAMPNYDAGGVDTAIRNGEDPSDVGWYSKGFYLTPSPQHASFFAQHANREGANVMPVHVSLKNPFIVHLADWESGALAMDNALNRLGLPINNKGRNWRKPSEQTALLQKMGHDGVLVYQDGKLREVVVHHPNQIKSATGNQGTFDPNEEDTNKAAGGRTGYADGGTPKDPLADLGKLNLGTPARAVDPNNFYSKAHHEALKLSQKKGSPQQIRAMLEKAGVKSEEINQSGYDEAFAGRPSITNIEAAQHFREKAPKLQVRRLYSQEHDQYEPEIDDLTRFDDLTLHGQTNYREHLLKLPEKRGEPFFSENRHWPDHRNVVAHVRMGDRSTPIDRDAAQAVIEKMKADDGITRFIGADPSKWGSGAADFALERGTITKQEAQALSRYRRWHNDAMKGYFPERNLHVEEIQSDWAQKGRKNGFFSPETQQAKEDWDKRFQDLQNQYEDARQGLHMKAMELAGVPTGGDAGLVGLEDAENIDWGKVDAIKRSHPDLEPIRKNLFNLQNDISAHRQNEPEEAPPKGPFVTSTPGWTNLTLKHILTEAVQGGYDRVVLSPGQANVDMYPGLDEKQQKGLRSFYDDVLPAQMNKLARSLDPDHPGMQMFSHTLPPVSFSDDTEGYKGHALDITPDLRDAVRKGLPMFKRGGVAERHGYADGGRPTNAFGMYSKGAEVAQSLPMEKANGQQMIAMLADPKRGVKKEELVNAGLLTPDGKVHPDWSNRAVTKSDLADHLNASLPKVAETSYGATHGYPYKYAVDWYNAIEKAKKAKNKDEVDRLTKAWGESMISENEPPRFQRYTLPGGESYRERLWHLDDADAGYQSSHWDADREHKRVPDVLAHVRMKDRTGPNGEKILHVEELQSDWGQEGRDNGFLTPENTEKRNAWQQKFYDLQRAKFAADDDIERRYDELRRTLDHSDPDYYGKIARDDQLKFFRERQKQAIDAYKAHHETMPQSDLIPTGPYVGSTEGWTDLALKRVLQEAVKGDYDKLVISPGEANADLYGQRRHVNTLVYRPDKKILQYYSDKDGAGNFPHEINPEELPKHIGSDLAQKLLSQPLQNDRHTLEGLDDIIGGQGMKKYYNRDVPQRLQKLVKGMDPDARVALNDFELPAGAQALDDTGSYQGHSLDITDPMREAVKQGLPAFKAGGTINRNMVNGTNTMLQKAISLARTLTRR